MSERASEVSPVMFKSKDRKSHEVISARNVKRCESKRCKIKSALINGKVVVFSRKSAACTQVSFKSAQAANDSVFRSGFCSGGIRDFT